MHKDKRNVQISLIRLVQSGWKAGVLLLLAALIFTQLPAHASAVSEQKRSRRSLRQERQQEKPNDDRQEKNEPDAAPDEQETPAVPQPAAAGDMAVEVLTAEQLQALTDGLDYAENGFFLSTYDRPEEISWPEVFYSGAGISSKPGENALAFLRERYGEIVTSVFALRTEDIAAFAEEKTGVAYSLARRPLSSSPAWVYYDQEDMYLTMHGDTNMQFIVFSSGTRQGSTYRLVYTAYDYETMAGTRDFVMTADIDDQGRWTYISNLPAGRETSKTLLTIDLYGTLEEASQAAGDDAAFIEIKKLASDEEPWQYAVITSLADDLHIVIDRMVTDGMIGWRSQVQWDWGISIPDTTLASASLEKGETAIININMPWNPRIRLSASAGEMYGEYWFGEDNYLYLHNGDGSEAQRYVTGKDEAADHGALHPVDAGGRRAMLQGSWVYYDPNTWEPAAVLYFDRYGDLSIVKPDPESIYWSIDGAGQSRKDVAGAPAWISSLRTYLDPLYQVDGLYTRDEWIYASASDAPDVLRIVAVDMELLDALPQGYGNEGIIGDYFVLAHQWEDAQVLTLRQANNGTGLLGEFLPGTDYNDVEFSFYRFRGACTWQSAYRDILADACYDDARAMEYQGMEDYDSAVQEWYLYDMNADDVPELFITYGFSEAERFTKVYTFADHEAKECGFAGDDPTFWTGHTAFFSRPDHDGLLLWHGQMGYFSINELRLDGEVLTWENLLEEEPPEDAAAAKEYSFTRPEAFMEGAKALSSFNIHTLLPLRLYSQYNEVIRSFDQAAQVGAVDEPAQAPAFYAELEQNGGEVLVSPISRFVSDPGAIGFKGIFSAGVLYEWSGDLDIKDIRYADLNRDGDTEVVLYLGETGEERSELILILQEQDGHVYGYSELAYSMEKLTADGTFCEADGDGYRYRVMFDGPECFSYIVQ